MCLWVERGGGFCAAAKIKKTDSLEGKSLGRGLLSRLKRLRSSPLQHGQQPCAIDTQQQKNHTDVVIIQSGKKKVTRCVVSRFLAVRTGSLDGFLCSDNSKLECWNTFMKKGMRCLIHIIIVMSYQSNK